MLAKERLAYIVNRLQVRPSISIQELSREMNVSFSTVQRDLRKLEADGKIERSRGGAVSNRVVEMLSGMNEVAVSEKIHLNKQEKEVVAKTAAKLIKDGECIFFGFGNDNCAFGSVHYESQYYDCNEFYVFAAKACWM